jgi:hypothetical protein
MDVNVHLVQRLLHATQAIRALGDERRAVTDQRSQQAHRFWRTERAAQQTATVQALQSFTVAPVRLGSAGDPAQLARID